MKHLKLNILAFAAMAALVSCGNNPDNTAGSTPIDSTNISGEAPAQFGPHDPANPTPPVYEGSTDSGLRANTASKEDSMKNRQ